MAILPQVDLAIHYAYEVITYHLDDSYGLVLSHAEYTPREVKTEYVSIPGRDGDLDFTTALTNGVVKYGNAELRMTFKIADMRNYANAYFITSWHGYYAEVTFTGGIFSTKKFKGRIFVDPISSAKNFGYVTIKMNVATVENYTPPAATTTSGESDGAGVGEASGTTEGNGGTDGEGAGTEGGDDGP